jgi:hypothetical protein
MCLIAHIKRIELFNLHVLILGSGNSPSIPFEILRTSIYKPARLFTSASQRRFAPTIASTPSRSTSVATGLPALQVALEGISGYRPAFSTLVHKR